VTDTSLASVSADTAETTGQFYSGGKEGLLSGAKKYLSTPEGAQVGAGILGGAAQGGMAYIASKEAAESTEELARRDEQRRLDRIEGNIVPEIGPRGREIGRAPRWEIAVNKIMKAPIKGYQQEAA